MSEHSAVDFEREDVNPKAILIFTASLVVVIGIMIVFLSELFLFEKEHQMAEVFLKPESVQLRELRAGDQEVLTSFKVLDPAKGVYQIPIDHAMKVMAEEAYTASQKK